MRRMLGSALGSALGMGVAAAACLLPAAASADQAVVSVAQVPRGTYAEPPDRPVQASEPPPTEADRSVLRLHLGPMAATTGRGLGPGLGVAADFGSGTLGFRLAAAWLHGEPSAASPSPIGGSLAQYTGELTLDLARRGPLHPVLGVGFGYARVDSGLAAGGLGVGTARAALEYVLPLDDAEVRFSAGVLGALPGPADSSVADLRGWALLGATIGVGF
jgi:hypothetical protein